MSPRTVGMRVANSVPGGKSVPRHRVLISLAFGCVVCFGADGTKAAAPDDAGVGNPLWTIPLNALTATRERPLFTPSRRPAMQAAPAAIVNVPAPPPPAAEPEQLALRLLGTITGQESGIAICLNLATNDVVRVRTGESFDGWRLQTIRGREATFEKASRQAVLALPSPDDPRAPALPPQIAGAQPLPLLPTNATPPRPATPQGSGTWMDGDGNMIAPPKR
jgi:general secretion pathway protein N